MRRWLGRAIAAALVAVIALTLWGAMRGRPQDLPWTPLDLSQPTGLFTGRKLAALHGDLPACRALLVRAGIAHAVLPARRDGPSCGYDDAVRLGTGGVRTTRYRPDVPGTSCAVAAALTLWEWNVVLPAARRHLGSRVQQIDHFGSYSCRRLYGRDAGNWSEHAGANAIDIAGFRMADGTRVTLVRDWEGGDAKAAFLREVRDGACGLFSTVLSPAYNAAHRDHFHFDQASRGSAGWRACR